MSTPTSTARGSGRARSAAGRGASHQEQARGGAPGGVPPTGLDPEQRAAVEAPRGPVCILAGAGTGKTRTITHRIGHLIAGGQVAPSQVLAVTFTARAAGELRGRLRSLLADDARGVQALTFHAAARRQLSYFWPRAVGATRWQLLDSKFMLVGRAAKAAGLSPSSDLVRDLASEIEWAKASLVSREEYPEQAARLRREPPAPPEKVAEVFARYEAAKTSPEGDRLLDFDDLLLLTTAILRENPAIAEEFRSRYRCFVVDEYQDVTPAQQALLDAWLGGRDDLTVVGDANQTIYSFGGATPGYLLGFSRRFPDATVVRLERDYRSSPQVVGLANTVIGAARGAAAGTRLRLIGQRPDGPQPQIDAHDDEPAEAAAVAKNIRRLIAGGVRASEIAILYRINAQSEVFENALSAEEVPYQLRGGEAFFARAEVRQAMRAIADAVNRDDLPEEASPAAVVRAVLVPLGYAQEAPAGAQARERWSSLTSLVGLVDELVRDVPDLTMAHVGRELAARAEARHPPTIDGVTLSSIHAAKGLEWDAVFVVGLADGTLPLSMAVAEGDAAIEEERRLLYVAVTRAREHLYLSWAAARNEGGRRTRKPSRFIEPFAPAAARPAGTSTRAACRVCGIELARADRARGRCDDCPADLDEELLAELKRWRIEQAREHGVPPYNVFNDRTLEAIAEKVPTSLADLGTISGVGPYKLEHFGDAVLERTRAR